MTKLKFQFFQMNHNPCTEKRSYKSRSSNEVGFLQETRPAIVHVCIFIYESCACVHTNKIKTMTTELFFFFMQAGGV